VVVADFPVETHNKLLVRVVIARRGATGIVIVFVLRNAADFVEVGNREAGNFDRRARTFRATIEGVGSVAALIGREEEQPILDNRAADIDTVTKR